MIKLGAIGAIVLSDYKVATITKSGLTRVSNSFSIGFLNDDYLSLFEDKDDLVQVKFETKTLVAYS